MTTHATMISALSLARLAAAFGTGAIHHTPDEDGYVEGITALTREQQTAAFGTGANRAVRKYGSELG